MNRTHLIEIFNHTLYDTKRKRFVLKEVVCDHYNKETVVYVLLDEVIYWLKMLKKKGVIWKAIYSGNDYKNKKGGRFKEKVT